jgi:cytochrome subunit of sulfide dehydrogenase
MKSIRLVLSLSLLGVACAALAQSTAAAPVNAAPASKDEASKALHNRALAATCANCHGTEGAAAPGSAVPGLAGMSRVQMQAALKAFRDGSRPATVMHQLSKGLTDQQIDDISAYYALAKR